MSFLKKSPKVSKKDPEEERGSSPGPGEVSASAEAAAGEVLSTSSEKPPEPEAAPVLEPVPEISLTPKQDEESIMDIFKKEEVLVDAGTASLAKELELVHAEQLAQELQSVISKLAARFP